MPYFDYDDDLIRKVIPNIQIAVTGEEPWTAKLTPFFDEAESFVDYWIASLQFIKGREELLQYAINLIVWRAWAAALPSLDLVATPNGFAVVSNQTLAPASKERVAAARMNAEIQADSCARLMISKLFDDEDWRESEYGKKYESLFPDLNIIPQFFAIEEPNLSLRFFRKNFFSITKAEKILAVNVISSKVLNRLRRIAIDHLVNGDSSDVKKEDLSLLNAVRQAVAIDVTDPFDRISYRKQCNMIIRLLDSSCSELANIWRHSLPYRAIKNRPFRNEKNSGGYFF